MINLYIIFVHDTYKKQCKKKYKETSSETDEASS